jgi:nitroreductase
MAGAKFSPLLSYQEYPLDEMHRRSLAFLNELRRRRTVRDFSERAVPCEIIETLIQTAATAPSGNNNQPWHFVAISDPQVKQRIYVEAEAVERDFYNQEATRPWAEALEHLGTTPDKPILNIAPWLIAIFAERYGLDDSGKKEKYYYIQESVGIATGMLITAVHNAGLVSLTYTPSRMSFLNRILNLSDRYKPFMILVVGYPAANARVPLLKKKSLEQAATFISPPLYPKPAAAISPTPLSPRV